MAKIKSNDHLYYCSHGLKRGEIVHKGILLQDFQCDYEPTNDYVKTKVVRTFEDAIIYFTNCELAEDGTYTEKAPEDIVPPQWKRMPLPEDPLAGWVPKRMPPILRLSGGMTAHFHDLEDDEGEDWPDGWRPKRRHRPDVWVEQLRLA